MSEVNDSGATKAIAETVGKGIDAARETGKFFAPFIREPIENAMGIVADRLKYARWERQIRLVERASAFLAERGLSGPTREIQLSFGVPLLEAATIEEDDDLQDIWARLLVNAADAELDVVIHRAFIDILRNCTILEVRILEALYHFDGVPRGETVATDWLPSRAVLAKEIESKNRCLPPIDVQRALWNLHRLGCLDFDTLAGGASRAFNAFITPLGISLVEACAAGDSVRK